MLIALLIAKIILTPNSLGAGFVGGVIGPALLIGSAFGAAYGNVWLQMFPGIHVSPNAFAMVATAAMLAGAFHAPLFGAMMIFEMNRLRNAFPVDAGGGDWLRGRTALSARLGLHFCVSGHGHPSGARHVFSRIRPA